MNKELEPRETAIKRVIKDYCKVLGIHIHHNLQGLGCYKGLPDMQIHFGCRVIYIEVKTPNGELSPYQKAFKWRCECDGVPYWVIHSIEELQEKIEEG